MRVYLFASLVAFASFGANANSGHIAAEYNRWKHLCQMIPECVAEQEAKREAIRQNKAERDLWLATPSKPKDKIPEWELMHKRLSDVKVIRRDKE